MATIHKAKDNSIKTILAQPELFAEFLRNFVPIDILKDVAPADIEDISEEADFEVENTEPSED